MDAELYRRACELLDFGPLGRKNCGQLCNRRCCHGDADDGMFLYPGEEKFYPAKLDWATITPEREPATGRTLPFLVCEGTCPRDLRPLACRTFPLLPGFTETGELELVIDKRGIFVCPLVRADDVNLLHPAFRRRAYRAWCLLLTDPQLREFAEAFAKAWKW